MVGSYKGDLLVKHQPLLFPSYVPRVTIEVVKRDDAAPFKVERKASNKVDAYPAGKRTWAAIATRLV